MDGAQTPGNRVLPVLSLPDLGFHVPWYAHSIGGLPTLSVVGYSFPDSGWHTLRGFAPAWRAVARSKGVGCRDSTGRTVASRRQRRRRLCRAMGSFRAGGAGYSRRAAVGRAILWPVGSLARRLEWLGLGLGFTGVVFLNLEN